MMLLQMKKKNIFDSSFVAELIFLVKKKVKKYYVWHNYLHNIIVTKF